MPKHKVRFEPVDIEIEVDEEETVLDAAFEVGDGAAGKGGGAIPLKP